MATVRLNLTEMYEYRPGGSIPLAQLPENLVEDTTGKSYEYFCRFQSVPSQYNTKKITSIKVGMTGQAGSYKLSDTVIGSRLLEMSGWIIDEDWGDPLNTYTRPDTEYRQDFPSKNRSLYWSFIMNNYFTTKECEQSLLSDNFDYWLPIVRHLITFGFYFRMDPDAYNPPQLGDVAPPYIKSKGVNAPYIEIEFSNDENSLLLDSCSPASGYQAKHTANTYTWSTRVNNYSVSNPSVSVAKFRYRADSSSQITEVNCGSALSYTMPANTIATNSFQWQVEITDANGNTSTSEWFTISTEEALSTANIVEPINAVLDGAVSTRFAWEHIISTGTAQTKADLQYSTDGGTTWVQFATPTGASTNTIIPANTFSAGSYLWRVRTYNTDNAAGSWSTVKAFTVIAKPRIYAVTSEQNPKPKISWQTDTQQAYHVYINDVFDSGILFGTATTYELPCYLDDGSYTVNVEVQNSFGLWSTPGTAPINVTNTPGTPMVLVVDSSDNGTVLTWTSVLSYAYYIVYRDNVAIAKTRDNYFNDLISLGTHDYYIRGIYASNKNYGLSNTSRANTVISRLMLVNLENKTSMSIEQNDTSAAELHVTDSITNTSVHISAADYPINEVSHFKKKNIRFSCAFLKNSDESTLFRTMLGHLVCIKTPSGTSVIGNLLEQSRSENYFYEKYTCSLSQTNYNEEIQL